MIGILNCYHFDPTPGSYQENYSRLILDFAKETFPGEPMQSYKVALGKWPTNLDDCNRWIITGSPKSAYEEDAWILNLKDLIVELHKHNHLILGLCFGHQLIASALGGKVEKSKKGWGVGVRSFEVAKKRAWMNPMQKKISLIFSHQDQVTKPPKGAETLASDDFCPHQILQIGENILTFQGHPEFSIDFAKERLNSRKELVGDEVYKTALDSFDLPRDHAIVRKWVTQFFNQKG